MTSNRIQSLDSLRGIASGLIVTHHIWIILPFLSFLFTWSPLRIFNNGRPAVILFFVLSGFVLSSPFLNENHLPTRKEYIEFLIKRFFRIYIPYIFAMLFTFIIAWNIEIGKYQHLSVWFNMFWHKEYFNVQYIIEHLLLIVNIHSETFNSVIWSLVHELRIALIFPFLVYFVNRNKLIINILFCGVLTCISLINVIFHIEVDNGYHVTFFETFHYTSIFIIGILIAKHRSDIENIYFNINKYLKFLIFLSGLFIYTYSGLGIRPDFLFEYIMAASAAIFIIFGLYSKSFNKVIINKPFLFLGKISYSLYLFHVPISISLIYVLHDFLPLWLVYIVAITVSLLFSSLVYRVIEKPAHQLARIIGKKSQSEKVAA